MKDVAWGWRRLRAAPGFTLMAALTLALGIGATSAIFSVVNGVLLKPLAFPDSAHVVGLYQIGKASGRSTRPRTSWTSKRTPNRS